MSFDGVVTRAVVHELSEQLVSGRILKIYQPTNTELMLTVRSHGKNHQLLLSVHPSYARLHVTDSSLTNPKEPPMFCMLLRKYISGGFIERIEQVGMERIVHIHINSRDEIGDETKKTLIMEIMGKHSNILLVDNERNVILDSIKHIPPSQNRHRTIMPGQTYVSPPEQGKSAPLSMTSEDFIRKLDFNSGKLDKQIVDKIEGFSPLIAKEIAFRAHLGTNEKYQQVFGAIQQQLQEHNYEPTIYRGNKEQFYVLLLESIKAERESFPSTSKMLDYFYSGKAERDRVKQQTGDIYRLLKNERDKNVRKIKKHEQTLQKAEQADHYKHYGELLTAHMHLVKKGDKKVKVVDYYDPEQGEVEIELNPNKTPSENAQRYFQTYQKLKKSKQVVVEEIQKATDEINYLDQLIQQLETAREQDLEEIREELQDEGYIRKKVSKQKNKPKNRPQLDEYKGSDGTIILVGRNNKQNEYLTNRLAHKQHIWLHAKDIPGSHVVIQDPNPSEETIEEAALLAAFFSKSKMSSTVPVDYTLVKNVKKPSGAKPGYVIYDNQKTVFVTPNEIKVRKLKEAFQLHSS
ncbi:putative ribosome quality control (RQC) complex YloA/Tae2 family protein [Salirhabdus euzebyi]|uniref:Rqc2 homolog RqcH n=1 Tax=Salirhabdus euzebyi TaxID=394506 RepID=A0A841Q3N6_9BACI|nr:NFACT RNA binding domain-containing protein [Salirhabdus euzebyi]MBB6452982.1 putative ribosome quality control (RQC) complex YloA/Tae2 family protein [Salirhabdus euzebyi]